MQGQRRLLSQNLSALLLRAERAAEAAETARETAALAASAGDPVLRAAALSLLGEALFNTGNVERALECAGEAERSQRERGDRMLALTLLRRADILDALRRSDEAHALAEEAQIVADRHEQRTIAATAALWVALHMARSEEAAGVADLRRALAEAKAARDGALALTRSLAARAEAWLDANAAT